MIDSRTFDPIDEARRQWVAHGWAEVADGMAAVTSLMRAQQIMLARVEEVLKPLGLTFARYELLMLLTFTRNGALPMSKASARLQVQMPSLGGYGGFRGDLGPLPGARMLPDVQRLPAELTFDFTIRND